MAEKLAPVYEMSWLTLTGDDSPLIQCYTSPTWNAFETSAQRMNDCIKTMLRLEVFKGSTFARFATSKVSEIQRQLYFRVVPASVLNSGVLDPEQNILKQSALNILPVLIHPKSLIESLAKHFCPPVVPTMMFLFV